MRSYRLIILAAFLAASMLISCTGNDECPLCPKIDTMDSLNACDVYLAHRYSNNLFRYNTLNPGKFDSIPLGPEESRLGSIGFANDGIHLVNGATNGVTIYNIQTREIVKTLPYPNCWVNVSRTGKYIALMSLSSETPHIYILDGKTLEVIRQTRYMGGNCCFSADDRTLYYKVYGTIHIIAYDIEGDSVLQEFDYYTNSGASPEIIGIQITDDDKELYIVSGTGHIYIYDIAYDTTTAAFIASQNVAHDMIEITPDGAQVLVSDPGDIIFEEPGTSDVIFFDVSEGTMSTRVTPSCLVPGEMDISPDGRYTFLNGTMGMPGFGVIDNQTHRYIDVFCTTVNGEMSSFGFNGVSCRRVLTN